MGLTLPAEKDLEAVGLIKLFDDNKDMWREVARRALKFLRGDFPTDAPIRHDDVAKSLMTVLEVHPKLDLHRKTKKLRQKYWIEYFADLIIDRVWLEIQEAPKP